MKSKIEVILALKRFAKEIGYPEAIITDASRDEKSKEVKQILNSVGKTLRSLEEQTL